MKLNETERQKLERQNFGPLVKYMHDNFPTYSSRDNYTLVWLVKRVQRRVVSEEVAF